MVEKPRNSSRKISILDDKNKNNFLFKATHFRMNTFLRFLDTRELTIVHAFFNGIKIQKEGIRNQLLGRELRWRHR